MPGTIVDLSRDKASGWAVHPRLASYRVLVHVVLGRRILCSAIASRPPPSARAYQSQSWFHIRLTDFDLSASDLKKLVFLIGETDEQFVRDTVRTRSRVARMTVEDILFHNFRRSWVTGETYLDAQAAGMADADIIDLLYRDILDRGADPAGLSEYLSHVRRGVRSLADIRRSLVESPEYAGRNKDASRAPGAIFSRTIVKLAAAEIPDDVEGSPDGANVSSSPESSWIGSEADSAEIDLPLESGLFGGGWHNAEGSSEAMYRWMEKSAVIFNPRPDQPLSSVSLHLAAVYGSREPMLDCYFDDVPARISTRRLASGFVVGISPAARARYHSRLRIESRAGGSPLKEGKGGDDRVLALNVVRVVYRYLGKDGPEAADDLPGDSRSKPGSSGWGIIRVLRRMTGRV